MVSTRTTHVFRSNGYRGSSAFCSSIFPNKEEIRFLEAAEYGDIPTVREMLASSTTLNVNCVDYMEQNALQLACGNEHFEVVEHLIKQPSMARIGDALLLAISKGYLRIAEVLMNHPSFCVNQRLTTSPGELILIDPNSDFYAYDNDGTRFSPDITPIILAAQCQEFDIVYELIRRGATIQHPHPYRCQCTECTAMRRDDALNFCLSRLNAYKGLASPVYMSIVTRDPVRHALKLCHELSKMATMEKEFKKDYLKLVHQLYDYLEKLLDICRNSEEVNAMLSGNYTDSWKGLARKQSERTSTNEITNNHLMKSFSNAADEHIDHPRLYQLKLAIKYGVKGFVANPNCQLQLIAIWNRDLSWLRQLSIGYKFLLAVGMSLFMPVLSIAYFLAPRSKVVRTMKSPFCKFATQGMSYAQFLMLLILNCMDRVEGFEFSSSFTFLLHQTSRDGRHTQFNWCEVFIMLYIAGLLWNEVGELWDEGPRNYIIQLWNVLDFFMLLILITSFASSFISHRNSWIAQQRWDEIFRENATFVECDHISGNITLFGRLVNVDVPRWMCYYSYKHADRAHWYGSDPQLIAEALYSFGIVLSFTRICYILEVNEKFGPLQISLLSTVGDIIKWSGIFFMIFGAFLLGLFNLYSYYREPEAKTTKAFTTIEETFITLFWSMFGLADYRGVEVKYDHQLTRIVGYQLYGAYNIITVIIMLNMLIAMINRSYSDVEVDSDLEWKFARAKLMLSYFDPGSTLPVPYNLLTLPQCIHDGVIYIYNLTRKELNKKTQRASSSSQRRDHHRKKTELRKRMSMHHINVMTRIVKRYVLRAQVEEAGGSNTSEADLQEIKHDISSLRYEVIGGLTRWDSKIEELFNSLEEQKTEEGQIQISTAVAQIERKSKNGRLAPPVLDATRINE
ncbi:short transient receptor potential channel 7-like isoform X3 [Ciona intestinalis]